MSTDAGRAYIEGVLRGYTAPVARAEVAVVAIEAEARRAALTSLRERVEGLDKLTGGRNRYTYFQVLVEIDRALGV